MTEAALLIDYDKGIFEVYKNIFDAKRVWRERLGIEKGDSYQVLDEKIKNGHLGTASAKVPNYYGTVWIAYKWSEDNKAFRFVIKGRWKDIKYLREKGFKIKKEVWEEYKNA